MQNIMNKNSYNIMEIKDKHDKQNYFLYYVLAHNMNRFIFV